LLNILIVLPFFVPNIVLCKLTKDYKYITSK
jgi:hypothetical protein